MKAILSLLIFTFIVSDLSYACEMKIESCIEEIEIQEPKLNEILNHFYYLEKLEYKTLEKLNKSRRKSAYLPQLQVSVLKNFRENQSYSIDDNVSVNSSGVNIGPEESGYDRSLNSNQTIQFRASWRLGDIIFNSQSLQIYRFSQILSKERDAMRSKISNIYFERRNQQILYLISKNKSKKILYKQKIKEFTQILNEYTNSKFNKKWWAI